MSPRFEIVEAKRHHCGIMARAMRVNHQRVADMPIASLHREIASCFDQSHFRKAWLIDGNLAALGGVIGTLASPSGTVWLALTEKATRYPIAIIKEARRQLDRLMFTQREIVSTVLLDDAPARRMAIFLGFHVAHEGTGSPACSRGSRRTLDDQLESFDSRILTIGSTRAIVMGYHEIEGA